MELFPKGERWEIEPLLSLEQQGGHEPNGECAGV